MDGQVDARPGLQRDMLHSLNKTPDGAFAMGAIRGGIAAASVSEQGQCGLGVGGIYLGPHN
jgi:hypothetical protein